MRSRSVIIFRAAEICLRSLATGCCCRRSFRERDSMSRSFWSISSSIRMAALASSMFWVSSALAAAAMASSHSAPMDVSSLLRRASCSSNVFRIYPNLPVM
jgi:hypothetical protein